MPNLKPRGLGPAAVFPHASEPFAFLRMLRIGCLLLDIRDDSNEGEMGMQTIQQDNVS